MTTSSIHICPHCEFTSSEPMGTICASCGRILKGPKDSIFSSPKYLFHQKNSLLKEAEKNKLNNHPDKRNIFLKDFSHKLHTWARECPTEDKSAAIYDAGLILENLLLSKTPPEELKRIITGGKNIGKLANALEEYFKAGGSHYDREVRQLRPFDGDTVGRQAAAPAGRD